MTNAFQYENAAPQQISPTFGASSSLREEIAANDDSDFFYFDEGLDKWPAWKTTSLVLFSCGLFWTGVLAASLAIMS